MNTPDTKPTSGFCPRCGMTVALGMDECPSCQQALCPECGGAVSESTMQCLSCGAEFELLCPNCSTPLQPGDARCERCGASFAAIPLTGTGQQPAGEVSVPVPQPPVREKLAPPVQVPACSICGRQDATLRVVSYPYVFSVVVVTFRRAFSGLWCRQHRVLRQILAGLITSIFGWLGIPFGFLFTPVALITLARGGNQPAESNVQLLKDLAEHKQKQGDLPGAIRCLEVGLRFRDDEAIRSRLHELYRRQGATGYERALPPLMPIVGALVAAAIVGGSVGVMDYLIVWGLEYLIQGSVNFYLGLLTWGPLVAMAFLAGVVLVKLVEWALASSRLLQMPVEISLAVVSASLMLYGLPEGRAIVRLIQMVMSGTGFASLGETISAGGAILTRGGVWIVWDGLRAVETPGIIYALILLVCAVYYVGVSIWAAVSTIRWRQRLAAIPALSEVWPARGAVVSLAPILAVVIGLIFLVSLFPQQTIVDYFEASEHNWRGLTWYQQGELNEAMQEFQQAIRLRPQYAAAHSNLGWFYYRQGDLTRAATEYEEAARLDPRSARARIGLGWAYYDQGQPDKAAFEFEQATHLRPDLAEAHNGLGWSYQARGEFSRAIPCFEQALKLDPTLAYAHQGLGWVYAGQGDLDKATLKLEEAVKLEPDAPMLHYDLGQLYLARNDTDNATRAFQDAIRLDPDHGRAHSGLGWVHLSREDLKQATLEFQQALRLAPNLVDAYQGMGRVYLERSEMDKALEQLEQAVRLNPSPFNYELLGQTYLGRAEFEKAAEQFKFAIQAQPNRGTAHAWLALTYYQLDQSGPMEQELQKAEAESSDAETQGALVVLYENLRQYSKAEALLQEALRSSPKDKSILVELADVYSALKKHELALQMCDEVLELDGNYGYAHQTCGYIYIEQRNLDPAIKELKQAVELARAKEFVSDEAAARSTLSFAYLQRGQLPDAFKEAQEGVQLDPYHSAAHTNLALIYQAQGQLDLALEEALEAVRLSPRRDTPHYVLGLCYMGKGDNPQAVAEFKRFLELYWDRAYVDDYKAKAESYLTQLK